MASKPAWHIPKKKLIKSTSMSTIKKVNEEARFPYNGILRISPHASIQFFYKHKLKIPETTILFIQFKIIIIKNYRN